MSLQGPPGSGRRKIDQEWDDDLVLPPVLSPDTGFVFRRMTEETLASADCPRGRRLLDVGCGRGLDAASLAQRGGLIFGCDPSRIMLRKAREGLRGNPSVVLVGGAAEDLPFKKEAFSRVLCKGAIDHFADPEQAVREMCRVASAGGKVVIAVANFASLSCSLGKKLNRLWLGIWRKEIPPPRIWEIPSDHTFKFDYRSIMALAGRYLEVDQVRGVSLLWGFPRWSRILSIFSPWSGWFLHFLDKIASIRPGWSDVLIIRGRPWPFFPQRSEKNG